MAQALAAIIKIGPADFTQRPAVLATRLALLEATEDFEGAKRLAQSSLQAADAQSSRGKPAKGQDAAAKALLYQSLARVQLKVSEALPNMQLWQHCSGFRAMQDPCCLQIARRAAKTAWKAVAFKVHMCQRFVWTAAWECKGGVTDVRQGSQADGRRCARAVQADGPAGAPQHGARLWSLCCESGVQPGDGRQPAGEQRR